MKSLCQFPIRDYLNSFRRGSTATYAGQVPHRTNGDNLMGKKFFLAVNLSCSRFIRKQDISTLGNILKVICCWISSIVILVMDYHPWRPWANEGQSDEFVDKMRAVSIKIRKGIASTLPHWSCEQPSNSSLRGQHVLSGKRFNFARSPYFITIVKKIRECRLKQFSEGKEEPLTVHGQTKSRITSYVGDSALRRNNISGPAFLFGCGGDWNQPPNLIGNDRIGRRHVGSPWDSMCLGPLVRATVLAARSIIRQEERLVNV